MSRPKNVDNILLALKAKTLEFDRENGITRGQVPENFPGTTVIRLIEDLKAIFFGNTKMVAPFYLDAIKQLEEDLTFVKPSQFDRLAKDAHVRAGSDEPSSVKRVRELAAERRQGIFRCVKCAAVLDITNSNVLWNKALEGYEHITDCAEGINEQE